MIKRSVEDHFVSTYITRRYVFKIKVIPGVVHEDVVLEVLLGTQDGTQTM